MGGPKGWSQLLTCGDEVAARLEGLVVKVVALAQRVDHVHVGVAEVHGGDGGLEYHAGNETDCGGGGRGGGGGAGGQHLGR